MSRAGLVACALLASACASNEPPRLESFEIWDGSPGAPGARQIQPGGDGGLTLQLDRAYTGRAHLRTAGRGDRCIYRVFSFTWQPPSREFACAPETDERLTIDEIISTSRFDVQRVREHSLTVALSEYDSASRQGLSQTVVRTFAVTFVP
jgi:hypothetical protein